MGKNKKNSGVSNNKKNSAGSANSNEKVKKGVKLRGRDKHPIMHKITVVYPDGEEFRVMSAYGKEGARLHTDSYKNHRAWTGEIKVNVSAGSVKKFIDKYGDLY